jgi:hypothetical protein
MFEYLRRLYLEKTGNDGDPSGGGKKGGDPDPDPKGGDPGPDLKGGDPKGGDPDPKATTWPEGWRGNLAGTDEKAAKRLERFATPNDVWNSFRALEQRMSSGELRSALPKDASEDETKQWRVDNGLPAKPDEYDLKFDNGLVVGDDDKPFVDEFLKSAHTQNMTPGQVKSTVQWYYDTLEKQEEIQQAADKELSVKTVDQLRADLGNEYRRSMNLIHGLLDTAPAGFKENFLGGRLADGTPMASSVDGLKAMLAWAMDINPVTTLLPGSSTNDLSSIESKIAEIQGLMGNKKSEYWKGPKAEKMQEQYRQLIDARGKMKRKAG